MRCPYCHDAEDRVIDTRHTTDGYMIRRRRLCMTCDRKFTTVEKIERLNIRVVKGDQSREPLDREKIRRGIERACSKRPVATAAIESAVQEIESEIYRRFDEEVPSSSIGEVVMKRLATLDEVAYIRFASVYKDFEGTEDFVRAVARIETGG